MFYVFQISLQTKFLSYYWPVFLDLRPIQWSIFVIYQFSDVEVLYIYMFYAILTFRILYKANIGFVVVV